MRGYQKEQERLRPRHIWLQERNISLKLLDGFIVLLIIAIAAVLVFFFKERIHGKL